MVRSRSRSVSVFFAGAFSLTAFHDYGFRGTNKTATFCKSCWLCRFWGLVLRKIELKFWTSCPENSMNMLNGVLFCWWGVEVSTLTIYKFGNRRNLFQVCASVFNTIVGLLLSWCCIARSLLVHVVGLAITAFGNLWSLSSGVGSGSQIKGKHNAKYSFFSFRWKVFCFHILRIEIKMIAVKCHNTSLP